MISRYLVVSKVPLNESTILVEIEKSARFLIKNVSECGTTIPGLIFTSKDDFLLKVYFL